jgi:hypothetical protein
MANTQSKNGSHKMASNDDTVEVLYQKMGDRWFAFSLVDDEVFVGSITQEEVDASVTVNPGPELSPKHVHGNS